MPISRILDYRYESVSASGVSVGVCALVAFRDDEICLVALVLLARLRVQSCQ